MFNFAPKGVNNAVDKAELTTETQKVSLATQAAEPHQEPQYIFSQRRPPALPQMHMLLHPGYVRTAHYQIYLTTHKYPGTLGGGFYSQKELYPKFRWTHSLP